MTALKVILPFVVYFFGGNLVWDIYYSGWDPGDSVSLVDIILRRVLVFGFVAAGYNAICGFINQKDNKDGDFFVLAFIPLISYFVTQKILPASNGSDILNIIVCVGSMIYSGFYIEEK